MADIEPRNSEATRLATGVNSTYVHPDRRQINARVTLEQFKKVQQEAVRQDTTMGEIMRQLIDLL